MSLFLILINLTACFSSFLFYSFPFDIFQIARLRSDVTVKYRLECSHLRTLVDHFRILSKGLIDDMTKQYVQTAGTPVVNPLTVMDI
jgi:hypothetical protein